MDRLASNIGLRVASAKMGGQRVGRRRPPDGAALRPVDRSPACVVQELNVAILKATTGQFHVAPKEKHVRTLKLAVHASQRRHDVLHVITELHRRLQDAGDWLTALKTLITLHRLMRETDSAFVEELVRYGKGLAHASHGAAGAAAGPGRLLSTDNFVDRTRGEAACDFSEWVRAYGKYLDEQLAVYATLRWYVEQEAPGVESRMRSLPARDLLFQLPYLQRLQRRLLDCVPRGAAMHDPVVLCALSLVVKESFKLYKAVSEGIINLADTFFEMELHDATHGLEYYREGVAASDALCGYYASIEKFEEIRRSVQLPKLSSPPADFLRSMEAYLAEAPRPLPSDGDVALPAKKGAPLRKGKLLQSSSFGVPTAVPTLAGTPPNRGMVLPVPVFVGEAGGVEIGASPDRSSASAAAAGLANSLSLAAIDDAHRPESLAHQLVVGPAGSNAGTRSPLDLLSGLDCNFDAAALPVLGGASASSANPFAPAVSVAHPLPGSSNPFGEHAAPGSAAHVAHPNLVGSMSDDFFASAGSLLPPFAAADSLVSPQGPGLRPSVVGNELSTAALHDPFASLRMG